MISPNLPYESEDQYMMKVLYQNSNNAKCQAIEKALGNHAYI